MKRLVVVCVVALPVFGLQADIGPRPTYVHQLHRIGYEVIPSVSPSADAKHDRPESVASKPKVSQPDPVRQDAPFDRESVIALLMIIMCSVPVVGSVLLWRHGWKGKCAVVLFWLVTGACVVVWFGKTVRDQMSLAIYYVPSPTVIREDGPGWKYEDQVGESEKATLMARVESVQEALQEAVNDSGMSVRTALHWQERESVRTERIRALVAVLAENGDLCKRCKGIPIEYFEDKIVFGRYAEARWRFETWAARQSKNLSVSENKVLFRWQLFVANKERRNWKHVFSEDGLSRRRRSVVPEGFSDFTDSSADGTSFVKEWYEKALKYGYVPNEADAELSKRAVDVRLPLGAAIKLTGNALEIKGTLSAEDATALQGSMESGLGRPLPNTQPADARTGSAVARSTHADGLTVTLTDADDTTLAMVCTIVGRRIRELNMVSGDGCRAIDLSPVAALAELRGLGLTQYRVSKAVSLCKTALCEMKAIDCDLGDIAFMKQVESLSSVHFKRCSFSSTENMRSSTKHCGTVVIQDAKSVVDLSFVRDMNGFENGYIEVDGKMMPCYLGGLETIDISGSRVENLSALGQCRQLKKVIYTVAELSGKDLAWLLDLGVRRGEGRLELHDSTEERIDQIVRLAERNPSPEHVRQVVKMGGDAKTLWRQYWLKYGRNPDIAYVGAMLENGADIDEQMQFGTALGQMANCKDEKGRTNRVAVMTALLERGADPNTEPKYDRSVLADVIGGPSFTGRVELVKLLLAKGADPNRADRMGKTAIDGLFTFGIDDVGLELAKLLLAHGADVKDRRLLGSMRRWKLAGGKFELVKTLVEKGVAIDQLAIGAAWPDLEIRRYLLQKTNTDESEYEVTEYEGGFHVHTGGKRDDRQGCRDQEPRFVREREVRERQLKRMDEHHRQEMAHLNDMRERRIAEDERSRQDRERQSLEWVETARQRLEEERRELLGRVNPSKRNAISKWIEERRAEEKARLDEIRATCKAEEERGRQLTETAHAEEVARERAQSEMRRKDEAAHLRRMQGHGVPEHVLREHEFTVRVREMHERHRRERDEAQGVRNRRFDSGSRLPSALSEYRRWLERRIEEERQKVQDESGSQRPERAVSAPSACWRRRRVREVE